MNYMQIAIAVAVVALIAAAAIAATTETKAGFSVKNIGPNIRNAYRRMMKKDNYIGGIFREDVMRQQLNQSNIAGTMHHVNSQYNPAPAPQMTIMPVKEGLMHDQYHWPGSGNYGNLSGTNPYGNYAGHSDMYYPVYNDQNNYFWSQFKKLD